MNAQFPDHLNDPELFELVKTYQAHTPSRTWWKYNTNKCRFSYGCYFTERIITAKPIDSKFSLEEKQEVFASTNTLLNQVKIYIDNNLCTGK